MAVKVTSMSVVPWLGQRFTLQDVNTANQSRSILFLIIEQPHFWKMSTIVYLQDLLNTTACLQ